MYLYPFLNTINKTRPFEYLRLTSLGVIGALVKVNTVCTHAAAVVAGGGVRHVLLPVSPDFTCLPVLVFAQQQQPCIIFHQVDDPDVVNFLLQTEIIPLCLRIMETGSELSKTVSRELLYHTCLFFSTLLTPDGRVLPNNTGGDLYCAKDSAG